MRLSQKRKELFLLEVKLKYSQMQYHGKPGEWGSRAARGTITLTVIHGGKPQNTSNPPYGNLPGFLVWTASSRSEFILFTYFF